MKIKNKSEFIVQIKKFKIDTNYIIVKPNWVSNKFGEYTEPEILNWLFEALPRQKKIIVESFTPWRGLKEDEIETDLIGGKKFWNKYREQDKKFLKSTDLDAIIKRYRAKYINVTSEFWADKCVEPKIIKEEIGDIKFKEFYSYIPRKIFELKDKATFISLAKIKLEEENPQIVVSLSIKNLFGLIPDPKRDKYHKNNDESLPQAIINISKIYNSLFKKSLWVNEGIKTLVKHYCSDRQLIEKNKKLLFIERNAAKVDAATCRGLGIDPTKVPYL